MKFIFVLFLFLSFSCFSQKGEFEHRKGFTTGDDIGVFKFEIKNGTVFISEEMEGYFNSFTEEIKMQSKTFSTIEIYTQHNKYKCYFMFGRFFLRKVEVFPMIGDAFYYE